MPKRSAPANGDRNDRRTRGRQLSKHEVATEETALDHATPPRRSPRNHVSSSLTITVPSKAQKLPFDVLREIFLWMLPTSAKLFVNPMPRAVKLLREFLSGLFPFNIARVCRAWQCVALSLPECWATPFIRITDLGTNGFKIVARWLETCLRKAEGTGRKFTISGVLKFPGLYSLEDFRLVLVPLLRRLERWEALEFDFPLLPDARDAHGYYRYKPVDNPVHVDLTKLTSLRKLFLDGIVWNCSVGENVTPIPSDIKDSAIVSGRALQLPILSSVTSLHLANLSSTTAFILIYSARQTLQELDFVCEDNTFAEKIAIEAPRLTRLNMTMSDYGPGHRLHPFLAQLRCDSLTDLSIIQEGVYPKFALFCSFVRNNPFRLTRLSITASACYADYDLNTTLLLYTLARCRRVRVLELRCMPSWFVLDCLSGGPKKLYKNGVNYYNAAVCPRLEELHIRDCDTGRMTFERLVIGRRLPSVVNLRVALSIRKVTFEDCHLREGNKRIPRRDLVPLTEESLGLKPEVRETLKERGVELVFLKSGR